MPKRIPIKALKDLSKEQGLTHAILYAYDGESSHVVTYGKNAEQCSQAADFGNKMKKGLGWPESLQQQPSRVRKLQDQNRKLLDALKRASSCLVCASINDPVEIVENTLKIVEQALKEARRQK